MVKKALIGYELIRGAPGTVAREVNVLIKKEHGWCEKGKPTKMTDNGCEILVQCMVKYAN